MASAGIAWASNQERASEAQVLEVVKMLVEELGADVNFVADTGETAMHAAAYRGVNTVVQYLFDKGAKLDVVDKSGRTPLQVADGVEYGNSFAAQSAHGGAAAQAGGEGNTVSGSVPECDSGRGVAARGGCTMTRQLALVVAATCCHCCGSPCDVQGTGAAPGAGAAAARRSRTHQAALQKHCFTCHNEKLKSGGLALSTLDLASVSKER